MSDEEEKLLREVKTELDDPKFKTYTHGKRSTYNVGCHGPLCRKAERDRGLVRTRVERGDDTKQIPATPARRYDWILEDLLMS